MALTVDEKEYVWVEKYRPKSVDDIILPQELKKTIRGWLKDDQIPNLLLSGRTPGTGKSSLCHTLIKETGADALFLNASLFPNIDILRSKIQGFVSTASFDGNPKIVVLDEADFLNANSTQPALRGFIESFSKNARFILTCNYKTKLIEPIRNRLIDIDFDEMAGKDKPELIKASLLRAVQVLKHENITYTKEDILWTIKHFYPSSRKILNVLQQFSVDGVLQINKEELDSDSLNDEIVQSIINKDFDSLRKYCQRLPDPGGLFLTLFDSLERFPQTLRPQIIITIAKYASWDSQVRDRLINSVACATEVMEALDSK
jgi:DNA polymerase III delta prime subunit